MRRLAKIGALICWLLTRALVEESLPTDSLLEPISCDTNDEDETKLSDNNPNGADMKPRPSAASSEFLKQNMKKGNA